MDKVMYWFIGGLVTLLVLVVLTVSIDLGSSIDRQAELVLRDKAYEAPYTTMIMAGKVLVPQYHSERFNLYFKDVTCEVSEDLFESSKVGDIFEVRYAEGGFTSNNYCTNVYMKEN